MKLVSVNVGMPRKVTYRNRTYPTSIYKDPVAGRVRVGRLNIDGDRQGNPKTHGGPDMAVYVYSHDHYPHWEADIGKGRLAPGAFGENLTVSGMADDEVCIGDVYRIGTARFQVTEPRTPCHKLAMKFGDPDLPRRFFKAGRLGFYFRVLDVGEVGAGDEIVREARDEGGITVAEVARLWADKGAGADEFDRVLAVPALSATWRAAFTDRRNAARPKKGGEKNWSEKRLTWV